MGMFDFLSQGNGILSGNPNAAPAAWQQAAGLFGATAKDVGSNLQGDNSPGNIAAFGRQQQSQNMSRLGQQAQQALADAGNDPAKLKAALLSYAAAGGDPSTFIAAAKFGSPIISNVSPTENVYSTDPLTGSRTLVQQGQIKPNFNQPFNADGTANAAYQAYQTKLARDRAQATADFRAPKSDSKVAPTFSIPHPGSQF